MSAATGITISLLEDLENYKKDRQVAYQKIAMLAKHYGVSADYLLGLSDCPAVDDKAKAACEYTGLNVEAVKKLNDILLEDDFPCPPPPAFREIASNFISSNAMDILCHNVLSLSNQSEKIQELINSTPEEKIKMAFPDLPYSAIANVANMSNIAGPAAEHKLADEINKNLIYGKVEIIEAIERFIDEQAKYSKTRQEASEWKRNTLLSTIDLLDMGFKVEEE